MKDIIGQHIWALSNNDTIGISLGSTWGYGLYYSHRTKMWLLTNGGVVQKVFPDNDFASASEYYYALTNAEQIVNN
jgi:hypothetical protein